jgi:hypothetical protein
MGLAMEKDKISCSKWHSLKFWNLQLRNKWKEEYKLFTTLLHMIDFLLEWLLPLLFNMQAHYSLLFFSYKGLMPVLCH